MEEGGQLDIQQKILVQLEKVSSRLEVVESQMAVGQDCRKKNQKHGLKLSTVKNVQNVTVKDHVVLKLQVRVPIVRMMIVYCLI